MQENQENEAINLIEPKELDEKIPSPAKIRVIIYACLILLLMAGLAYSIKLIDQASSEPFDSEKITLQPRKLGVFQIIKNFIFPPETPLAGEDNDRINILLLGMGGLGHDGPYLTDTNIILSVKPNSKEAALISIPRDLQIKINGYGYQKINYANSYGELKERGNGGDFARKIFSETFGLEIPYYVRVDFQAFKETIDAVGGLSVNIPMSFTDYSYPGPNDSYQTVSFQAGEERMNGERALIYARSRHGDNNQGSDFARARRQQQVLEALKDKILSAGTYLNPVKINKIMNSLNNHMTANLELNQMMGLAHLMKEVDGRVKTLVVDASNGGYLIPAKNTAAYLLVPRAGNFNEINQAIKNIFMSSSSISDSALTQTSPFPRANIEIQNGTWKVGIAVKTKEKLEQEGLSITAVGNSFKRPIEKTIIYLMGKEVPNEILDALKNILHAEISADAPEWLNINYDDPATTENETGLAKYKEGTEVLIILGNDTTE